MFSAKSEVFLPERFCPKKNEKHQLQMTKIKTVKSYFRCQKKNVMHDRKPAARRLRACIRKANVILFC